MFKDEMRQFRKKMKISLEQLGQAVQCSKTTIMRYESGAIATIPKDKMVAIAKYLGMDVDKYLDEAVAPTYTRPLLGFVKAGYDLFCDENYIRDIPVSQREYYQGDYFLEVVGDSMTGLHIYPGDQVYIRHQSDVESNQIAVVLIDQEEVTIKKVIKKGDVVILESANPAYENRYYTLEEIQNKKMVIIGRVLFVKREF